MQARVHSCFMSFDSTVVRSSRELSVARSEGMQLREWRRVGVTQWWVKYFSSFVEKLRDEQMDLAVASYNLSPPFLGRGTIFEFLLSCCNIQDDFNLRFHILIVVCTYLLIYVSIPHIPFELSFDHKITVNLKKKSVPPFHTYSSSHARAH